MCDTAWELCGLLDTVWTATYVFMPHVFSVETNMQII